MVWKKVVPVKVPVNNPGETFKGKNAIVTGGGSGIGHAIAKQLSANGCNVYILGRNEEKLRKASEELHCHYRVLDVSDVASIPDVVDDICSECRVDILVNSAGVLAGGGKLGDTDLTTWEKIFNTNARGTFFMTQVISQKMKEQKIHGHILNLSSSSALRPCYSVYNISKHVIKDMTVGFAKELIPYGIVVNAIGPGPTATKMMTDDANDLYSSTVPAGRFATVDEIANLALYMLSDFGNMIVGATYYITGGSGITTQE